MKPRVAVTAAGVISPLGAGLEKLAFALYEGQNAAAPSRRFPGIVTAEISELNAQDWLGKGIRTFDRSARLLAVAAQMALSAGKILLDDATADPELGLVCGTVFGSLHSITSFDWSGLVDGPAHVNPMEFPNTVINSPAGQAAIKHKLRGVNSTVCGGLASGLHAIHYAAEFLRLGRARILLAGGVEEISEESILGVHEQGTLATTDCARPFAWGRNGIVAGEGAALCLLETGEIAAERQRVPWLEILGFGTTQSICGIGKPDPNGCDAADAMRQAIAFSDIEHEQISCIVASANGNSFGDTTEMQALKRVFGSRLGSIPACAPKASFGEMMGAYGALGVIVAGLALQQQRLPPTSRLADIPYPLCMSADAQPVSGEYALVNAVCADGNTASLVVRTWTN